MEAFEKFYLMSGLKMNNAKTQIVWIGGKNTQKIKSVQKLISNGQQTSNFWAFTMMWT